MIDVNVSRLIICTSEYCDEVIDGVDMKSVEFCLFGYLAATIITIVQRDKFKILPDKVLYCRLNQVMIYRRAILAHDLLFFILVL